LDGLGLIGGGRAVDSRGRVRTSATRGRVANDVVHVYDRQLRAAAVPVGRSVRGWTADVPGGHGTDRTARARLPRADRPAVAAVRGRERVAERVLDVDPLQRQRLLLGSPLERLARPARRARPSRGPPLLGRRGLRGQHAGRPEVIGTREHHAPADRVD